jgi:CHAD domain-containing protein
MEKWVKNVDGERPAAEAAAEILRLRLEYVEQQLPLAAAEYACDIEHVHQLRVACRRSAAALAAFRPLAKGKAKPLRKWLQKVRRAAGPARDIDVLLQRLWTEANDRPCHAYIVARLERQRHTVQHGLVEVAEEAQHADRLKSVKHCLKALGKHRKKKTAVSFNRFAHDALRMVSQGMFEFAEVNQPTVKQLHQLRIASKQLRYSIELFHTAFSQTLRVEVYPLVEEIQSKLGRLNDHATAQVLYQHWLVDLPANERAAQLAQRIVEEFDNTEALRNDFIKWWSPERVGALESYLSELIHPET